MLFWGSRWVLAACDCSFSIVFHTFWRCGIYFCGICAIGIVDIVGVISIIDVTSAISEVVATVAV